MKIGYLMNSYPMTSTTFIGREIAALEAIGFDIRRYAIRPWEGTLVDPHDQAEQARTLYLLTGSRTALAAGLIHALLTAPRGVLAALRLWWQLMAAGGGVIRHAAYLLEAMALRRAARRDGVAHIHAHFSTNSAAVAMLAEAMGGPAFSFTVHGPDEFFTPFTNSLALKIERAAFVACISHFCRSQCMALSDPACWDRLRIVHCGVDPARYDTPPEPSGPPHLLFVGRLSRVKGMAVLLEAFARILPRHPGTLLTLVGDGPERAALEAQARSLGVEQAVRFEGFLSQAAVAGQLAAAAVFVLPSFAEGLPVVLMEAMASRRPVVATRIAGVAELVEDGVGGFLVPPGDVEALADRLDRLLADPDLRVRMGLEGRRVVERDFAIAREAAWLGEILRGAVAGRLPDGLRPIATGADGAPRAATASIV